MEVEAYQLDGFVTDAQIYIDWLQEDVSDEIITESLGVLTTYLNVPEQQRASVRTATSLAELAKLLFLYISPRGNWSEIATLWPEIWLTLEPVTHPILKAELITQLAIIKNNQGEAQEATRLYEHLVVSSDFNQLNHEQQTTVFHHMGVCYVRQGNYKQAQKVLKFCANDDLYPKQVRVADSRVDGSRPVVFSSPFWETQAYAWNQLGNIAMALGDAAEAYRSYEASLQLFVSNNETHNLACVAYQSLGRLLIRQKAFEKAIPYLEQGIEIRRQRGERDAVASTAVQLAEAFIGTERLSDAEALLNEALRIYEEIDEPYGKASCYFAFGQLELKCGRRIDAIQQWQQALNTLSTTQMAPLELQILVALIPQLIIVRQFQFLFPAIRRFVGNLWKYSLNPQVLYRLAISYVIGPSIKRLIRVTQKWNSHRKKLRS